MRRRSGELVASCSPAVTDERKRTVARERVEVDRTGGREGGREGGRVGGAGGKERERVRGGGQSLTRRYGEDTGHRAHLGSLFPLSYSRSRATPTHPASLDPSPSTPPHLTCLQLVAVKQPQGHWHKKTPTPHPWGAGSTRHQASPILAGACPATPSRWPHSPSLLSHPPAPSRPIKSRRASFLPSQD